MMLDLANSRVLVANDRDDDVDNKEEHREIEKQVNQLGKTL